MTFSEFQQRALTIVPKATSLVSTVALVTFLRCVFVHRRENLQKMYHRLVIGMSIVDLIRSASFLVGTSFMPQHTGDEAHFDWAIGNNTTCALQGFINQIGLAVPLYGAALCIYAYLTIRNNFNSESIASVEKWLHGLSLSLSMILAIALVASDSATRSGSWCWLPPFSLTENRAGSFVSLFSAGLVLISFLIGIVMILFILITERKKQKERKEWRGKKIVMERARAKKANHLTNQAILHLLALIICNLFVIIIPISAANFQHFPCLFTGNVLITLSGFLNAMIYTKLLNPFPPPVSDIAPSFCIRQLSANDLPIVTHGFMPCKKISSTFGNMFVLNDQKYNADDFAVFTGEAEDETDVFEKGQSPDMLSVTTADVESVGDISSLMAEPLPSKSSFLGRLI